MVGSIVLNRKIVIAEILQYFSNVCEAYQSTLDQGGLLAIDSERKQVSYLRCSGHGIVNHKAFRTVKNRSA